MIQLAFMHVVLITMRTYNYFYTELITNFTLNIISLNVFSTVNIIQKPKHTLEVGC